MKDKKIRRNNRAENDGEVKVRWKDYRKCVMNNRWEDGRMMKEEEVARREGRRHGGIK